MKPEALRQIVERAESWPEWAQAELLRVAAEIEADTTGRYHATADEIAAIDRGMAAARAGRIASEPDVAAVLAKYRGG